MARCTRSGTGPKTNRTLSDRSQSITERSGKPRRKSAVGRGRVDAETGASQRTDLAELQMVEEGRAYYLVPGTLVRVTSEDQANGMSGILLGGIAKPLWTYTRFLTARPIRDIYGIVETPDTAGLIDPGDAAGVRSVLNERSQGGMP